MFHLPVAWLGSIIIGKWLSSLAVNPDLIYIEDGIAMIAVVGRAMINEKGVARRVFSSIEEASINIRMIDQGSSEINIIIGVAEKDYTLALKTIYSEFVG